MSRTPLADGTSAPSVAKVATGQIRNLIRRPHPPMKKILLLAACGTSLSLFALPTYEPFTEFNSQIPPNSSLVVETYAGTPVGSTAGAYLTNCIDLATGGFSAPSGEPWTALLFSGTLNTQGGASVTSLNYRGLDIAVVSNSTIFPYSSLSSLLPSGFPGLPASNQAITNCLENPAQPLILGTSYAKTNYVGNSAVLKFAQDITRPASGTKTIYISYLFNVAQLGALATGNQGRYLAFVSATNLSEGWLIANNAPVAGAAFTNFASMFNQFPSNTGGAVTNHYLSHGLLEDNSSTYYIGACDSSAGKCWSTSPFTASFGTTIFVVGAVVLNSGANHDTNMMWVNPALTSFGGAVPPSSPQIWTTNMFVMSDIGGLVIMDRPGAGMSGGVGTNYIANLLIGSTWSYVTGGPEFTNQPIAMTQVPLGQNVSISAAATAAGQSVSYQWVKISGTTTNTVMNGANGAGGTAMVSGATTTTLTLTGFSANDAGNFQLVATASGTGFKLNSSNAQILPTDPQFTANPANVTVYYGQNASFTAQVSTAYAPLNYQWYNGTAAIANGTQADGSTASNAAGTTSGSSPFTLTINLSGVTYQESGSYALFATNTIPIENSSAPATLTVFDPYITSQPAAPSAAAGGTANFTVAASGSPTLLYQWYENGTALNNGSYTPSDTSNTGAIVSGAQSSTLTLTGVQDIDNGAYTCAVSSTASGQTTNSFAANLVVQDALTVVSPPMSLTERVGDHLAFAMGVTGGGPQFQWYSNNVAIPGATRSALVLTNIQPSYAATYSVTVQNAATAPSTYSATLTVINSTVLNLSPANLVVARVGDGAQSLSGATGNTLYLDQYTENGSYQNTIQVPDEAIGSAYGSGSGSSVPGSPALLVPGAGSDASSEAMLTLSSVNQEYLCFAGYCENYPFSGADVTVGGSGFPNAFARGLGTINAFGTYSLTYTNSGLYNGGNHTIRSATTSDGVNFWTSGQAGGGTIKYMNTTVASYQNGSGIPSSTGDTANGGRVVQIINGPLPTAGFSSVSNLVYSETASNTDNGLYVATGNIEPSPGGNVNFVPLLYTGGGQPADFAFSPDNSTIYIAEATAYTGGGPGAGGIERWDTNGLGGWSYSYTLPALPGQISNPGAMTNGVQGLTVDFSASTGWGPGVTGARIFATTTGASTNSLVEVVDNGNPALTGGPTINVIATAGPNQALRGVRFGPSLIAPSFATSPLSQTNFPNNTVSFSAVALGSGPLTYVWLQNGVPLSNGSDPTGSGATIYGANTSTLTVSNLGNLDNNTTYALKITNPANQSATSAAATLSVTAGAPIMTPTVLASYTETVGDHVGWSPTLTGTYPITNYWYLSGNLLYTSIITGPGMGGGLVISNIQVANSGTYSLIASNLYGHVATTGGGVLNVTTTKQMLSSANLVVARIGDGVQTLSSATGNTLYLDQYTPAGAYVNSIQIPDEGAGQPYGTGGSSSVGTSPALIFAGAGADATYEAFLTLSPNGQALSFAGYCQAYPFSGADVTVIAGGSANWHGIAEVNAYGYYTLNWTNTGLYSAGGHQVHGAVDIDGNGTNWYTTGQAGSGYGIKYANTDFEPASGNGIASIAGSFPGTHVAQVITNNGAADLVYSDAEAGTNGIYACSGIPDVNQTTAISALIIASTNSPMDFAVSPDNQTVYVTDNGTYTGANNVAGGIQRWDSTGIGPSGLPTYALSYTLPTGTGNTTGARALAVDFSASQTWGAGVTGAKIYATTAEVSSNRLIKIVDTGSASTATQLATATANEVLAGIRFGPIVVNPNFAVQPPATLGAFANQSVTLSSEALGSGPLSYQWYFQANGVGNYVAISAATNANYTFAASSAKVGNYEVVVTNPGGLTATSTAAAFGLYPPPRFVIPPAPIYAGPNLGFTMSYTGPAGVNYSIWTTTDPNLLNAPVESTWTKLGSSTFSGGTDTYTDYSNTAQQQFYQLSVP